MAWFKVDDKLHDHRKARQAGTRAMGVWLLAGTWSADNLTDGFVPSHVLSRWGTKADARRLVEAGLWREGASYSEVGWWFHEWHDHQPTREQVEDRRKKRADAGRLGGLKSAETRVSGRAKSKQSASPVASGVVEANANDSSTPTRPDPTRPSDTDVSDTAADAADRFDDFWSAYPRKVSKPHARKAWKAAAKKADADVLITAAAEFATWCKTEGTEERFIAHPATWLNGERWNDERAARTQPQSRIGEHLTLVQQLAAEEAAGDGPRQIGSSQ